MPTAKRVAAGGSIEHRWRAAGATWTDANSCSASPGHRQRLSAPIRRKPLRLRRRMSARHRQRSVDPGLFRQRCAISLGAGSRGADSRRLGRRGGLRQGQYWRQGRRPRTDEPVCRRRAAKDRAILRGFNPGNEVRAGKRVLARWWPKLPDAENADWDSANFIPRLWACAVGGFVAVPFVQGAWGRQFGRTGRNESSRVRAIGPRQGQSHNRRHLVGGFTTRSRRLHRNGQGRNVQTQGRSPERRSAQGRRRKA
jgi:hypothetical protein